MTGSVSANFHEGSRSELLADYLFSSWGTVTPVRRQDDYGVDLYCTLTIRDGQRAVVADHYAVQVKSNTDPWVFDDERSVRWLIEHPTPLFLACVDKPTGVLSVYHVAPRFYVWAMGKLPARLELRPEATDAGRCVWWEAGDSFSLSAPILRVTCTDLVNGRMLAAFREVLARWVSFDRENCDLVRQGLLRFRMPYDYRTNEPPPGSMVEQGLVKPDPEFLVRGIVASAEAAECIGSQLGRSGDLRGALFAALFVDHLQLKYPDAFANALRWRTRLPGDLGHVVADALNQLLDDRDNPPYRYKGIETVADSVCSIEIVRAFLGNIASERERAAD